MAGGDRRLGFAGKKFARAAFNRGVADGRGAGRFATPARAKNGKPVVGGDQGYFYKQGLAFGKAHAGHVRYPTDDEWDKVLTDYEAVRVDHVADAEEDAFDNGLVIDPDDVPDAEDVDPDGGGDDDGDDDDDGGSVASDISEAWGDVHLEPAGESGDLDPGDVDEGSADPGDVDPGESDDDDGDSE